MASNRILYLGVLIICTTFYFASGIWFSWILLLLIAAMPVLSLLLSLPAMLSSRLLVQMPDTVEQGESTAMHLQLNSWIFLPQPEVHVRLNLRTRDVEKDLRFLSHLSRVDGVLALPTDTCGFLAPELRRGWVYDMLGLFRIPLRVPKIDKMAILPISCQPNPMPRMDQFLQQQMKPRLGGGYSEQHDHRPYRPGDPVKSIHWKLSMKTEALIVREPLEPIRRKIVLAVQTPRGKESRAVTLGNLRYFSAWLLEHGLSHEAVWMDGSELRSAEINTEQDARFVLRSACLAPANSEDLPAHLPIQAEWICCVGQKGGREG
ncbi:MAG: DUF58 domain-containing protein [Oscillospiraceae bacterium]|nr:DUF58 domain-containing protein [Oscillospiraceae bacterium]